MKNKIISYSILLLIISFLSFHNFLSEHQDFLPTSSYENSTLYPKTSEKIQIGYEWLQTWIENYEAHCYATTIDDNGNIFLAGQTKVTNGNKETCLVKYNNKGIQQFNITWHGSSGDDECRAIALDSSGSIFLTGYIGYSMYLAKFDSSGVYQWHRTWSRYSNHADRAHGIAIDSLDNIYIGGESYNLNNVGDMVVIKYNSTGNEQWYKFWGGNDNDRGFGLSVDTSNHIYLVGSTYSYGSGRQDMALVKYDINGQQLWNRTWGGTDEEFGSAIALDSSNNLYITGSTKSYGEGDYDMALVKYDTSGNLVWNRTYGEGGREMARAITVDNSDNIYIGGINDCNIDIIKYDISGSLLLYGTWNAEKFGETSCDNDEYCFGIETDSNNNIYIAGYVQPEAPAYMYCIKCNSEFKSPWEDYIIFSRTIEISKSFTTDMELDPIAGVYRDRTHIVEVAFLIIGFNNSIKVDVSPTSSAIKTIKIILKNKENSSINEFTVDSGDTIIFSSYEDNLFQFYLYYSYSYISCVYSSDGYYCDQEETKTATGEKYSDFIDIKPQKELPLIPGYDLSIVLAILIGFSFLYTRRKEI
jgi:uncharacterized delta-60 repeat protein